MRRLLVVTALTLCWGGQTFAQAVPGLTYAYWCRNFGTSENGIARPLSGLPVTAILLRYPIEGESCGLLSGFQPYLRQHDTQPIMFLAANSGSRSGSGALTSRLTSNSFGLRYRIRGLVVRGSIGEYQATRPNARVFLVRPNPGGLFHQIEASGGIGFYF